MRLMCAVLEVSPAGFLRLARARGRRTTSNAVLLAEIRQVHRDSGQRYGSARVHSVLRSQGRGASQGRIERLMRRYGIRAIMAPPLQAAPPQSSQSADCAEPDRASSAPQPPIGPGLPDITYISPAEGWLYRAR